MINSDTTKPILSVLTLEGKKDLKEKITVTYHMGQWCTVVFLNNENAEY